MDRIAEKLSIWFGSTPFVIFHVIWFALWFVFHLKIDLLTLIVSLEAIFLSLFILRAENFQGKRVERINKEQLYAIRHIEEKIGLKDVKVTKKNRRKRS